MVSNDRYGARDGSSTHEHYAFRGGEMSFLAAGGCGILWQLGYRILHGVPLQSTKRLCPVRPFEIIKG